MHYVTYIHLVSIALFLQGANSHHHSTEGLQSLPISRDARLQRYKLQVHAFRLLLQIADPFGTRGVLFEPNAVGESPADYLFEKTEFVPFSFSASVHCSRLFSSLL